MQCELTWTCLLTNNNWHNIYINTVKIFFSMLVNALTNVNKWDLNIMCYHYGYDYYYYSVMLSAATVCL